MRPSLPTQYSNLDMLRSAAVLMVLASHLLAVFRLDSIPFNKHWGVSNIGHLGVLIFFIHTALVLMMSLERHGAGEYFLYRFYVRRLFRIYPLSVVVVVLTVFLHVPSYFHAPFVAQSARGVISNLFLVQNLTGDWSVTGPLWSLPFEVQMYLALPLLFLLSRRRSPVFPLGVGFGVWFAAHLAVKLHIPHAVAIAAIVEYAPWFSMGIAAFGCVGRRRAIPACLFPVALAGFVLVWSTATPLLGPSLSGYVVWASGVAFALGLMRFRDSGAGLIVAPAKLIARYSYGIYLLHVPIMWLSFEVLKAPMEIQWAMFIGLMAIVPAAAYHAIEKPCIDLGAAIASGKRGRVARSAVATA